MKILLIKTLFCPNEEYLKINLKSFIKTNIYIKSNISNNFTFDLLLIGWSHLYNNIIDKFMCLFGADYENIYTEHWTINYGKYKVLNYSIDFIKNNDIYDYILYMDHDLYFELLKINSLTELVKLFDIDIELNKIGMLVFNQKQDIRHQPTIYENVLHNNNNILLWTNNNHSIATGAYLVKSSNFIKLPHFKIISVYGLDDYYLCTAFKDMGLINVVLHNNYVIHPYDNNIKYNEWKKANIIDLINNKKIDYFKNIEQSMNIFK